MTRLLDLVNAMEQWARTLETEAQQSGPTHALFTHLGYPPENKGAATANRQHVAEASHAATSSTR